MNVVKRIIFLLFICTTLFTTTCSRHPHTKAQGYIEGRYTYMATSVSGVLQKLLVQRGAMVKQGQMLFVLEEKPEIDAYAAAVENLKQSVDARNVIIANLSFAKITYQRNKILVAKNAIEQSQLDNAKSNYDALLAQLSQANANIAATTAVLQQAKWSKDQKIIYAPTDAIVFDTYFRLGEYTEANQSILSLLAPGDIKAIFYVSEEILGSLTLGEAVSIQCDGCRKAYAGKISFISPTAEYTPPVIYSNETSSKLIYRIEAAVNPEDVYYLHPGQPVVVTIS